MSTNGKWLRTSLLWLLITLAVVLVAVLIFHPQSDVKPVNVSTILSDIKTDMAKGQQDTLDVSSDTATLTRGKSTDAVRESATINANFDATQVLKDNGIDYSNSRLLVLQYDTPSALWGWLGALGGFIPLILFGVILLFMFRQAQGSNNQAMSFGKSRARMFMGNKPTVTFADVAGVDESKQELQEVVEFLKYPEKFNALGARIPRGVLLIGPPGTGKTLISRAVAGEAGVPFFSISGSEFVEMFVGVGASRVRDLFEQAKRQAPSIIFIDEIDAVGRKRSAGHGNGAHDEREQTLNQILVEMDGFEGNKHVIVLAATNRPDVLDPALLRPGRFDRQVTLANPDVKERTAILTVHSRGKPLHDGVRLDTLARSTPGFSGADLANLVNEGAILAVRKGRRAIDMLDLQEAIDRVIAGPQKKARVMSALEQRRTAYHEAGHAVVGRYSDDHDPVHKVTIVSRGRMGGYTRFLPEEDRHYMTRAQFEASIASALGGWAAERRIFGDVSTGASNDIEKATLIARSMVSMYGMSERLGPRALGSGESGAPYSERIAEAIDAEVHALIDAGAQQAEEILTHYRMVLDALAARLLDVETVEGEELELLFQGASEADAAITQLPTYRRQTARPRVTKRL